MHWTLEEELAGGQEPTQVDAGAPGYRVFYGEQRVVWAMRSRPQPHAGSNRNEDKEPQPRK